MIASRRTFLMGAAAASAAALTPDMARAAQAMLATPDWSLVTGDIEADVAPQAMRLVQGRAPAGLSGILYRNGPAKFRRPGRNAEHWFDGDGLIRRFAIDGDQVQLAARFADTPKRRQESRLDAMVMPGFGTQPDPRAEISSADDVSAANTSVLLAGGDLWALWEGGSPLAMDPISLETRGFVSLRPDLKGMPFLAHPRIEPDGTIWNLGLGASQAIVWRLSPEGSLQDAQVVALPRASYLHDFTATDRHLVIVLQPWVRVRNTMPFADGFEWQAGAGTQVLVLDKNDLSQRRVYELPDFGFFHLGDAWRDGDDIRFDVCALPDMDFAARGAQRVLNGVPVGGEPARLALATLRANGTADLQRLPVIGEFPKGDPRRAGLPRQLTVHTTGETPDRPFASAIGVTDWSSGQSRAFDFGLNHVTDEFLFVPRPGGNREDDGWLVGPSLNLAERATELHVLDVARIEDGPVATWRASVALPAAFHGTWQG